MTNRFVKIPEGILVDLDPTEFAVLERIPDIVGSIGASGTDPASQRLDPDVHPSDPAASGEFSRLAGAEVADARIRDAARFASTLTEASKGRSLTVEDGEAWVRTLGTARVTLATRHGGITDDASFAAANRSDPDILLVDYLGMLQEDMVTVLLADPQGVGE